MKRSNRHKNNRLNSQLGERSSTGRLALEAMVASIPYIGPALQTAVFTRLNEKRLSRIERLFKELNEHFNNLGSDPDFLDYLTSYLENNERFMVFVRHSLEKIAAEYDNTKFEAYKIAFINGFINKNLSVNVKLAFLRMIDRVGVHDLQVLGFMANKSSDEYITAGQIIAAVSDTSEHEKLLILSAIDTLANLQLIEVGRVGLDANGRLHRQRHDYRLTQLGRSFVNFIGAGELLKSI